MATYTKKLKTVVARLMLDSQSITIEDKEDDMQASTVIAQFERGEDLVWVFTDRGRKETKRIPYHAIQDLSVTSEDAEATKIDPYYCEESESAEDDDNDDNTEGQGGGR